MAFIKTLYFLQVHLQILLLMAAKCKMRLILRSDALLLFHFWEFAVFLVVCLKAWWLFELPLISSGCFLVRFWVSFPLQLFPILNLSLDQSSIRVSLPQSVPQCGSALRKLHQRQTSTNFHTQGHSTSSIWRYRYQHAHLQIPQIRIQTPSAETLKFCGPWGTHRTSKHSGRGQGEIKGGT